jgi:hypothetical protein
LDQVIGQQIHEQTVVPAGAIGITLIPAHDADRAEANRGVAPNGAWLVRKLQSAIQQSW